MSDSKGVGGAGGTKTESDGCRIAASCAVGSLGSVAAMLAR